MSRRTVIRAIVAAGVVAVAFALATSTLNRQVNASMVVARLARAIEVNRESDGTYPANIDDLRSEMDRHVLYVTNGRHFVVAAGRDGRPPRSGFERWMEDDVRADAARNCLNPYADTIITDRGPILYCLK